MPEPVPIDVPDLHAGEPLHPDGDLDWEALKAGRRLHLYCYLRDTVVALALFETAVRESA
jgi:hypothetical protein